jgi:hypothetical protein
MNAAERLRLEENPFAAASGGVGPPLRTALREVTREIALETPIVVLEPFAFWWNRPPFVVLRTTPPARAGEENAWSESYLSSPVVTGEVARRARGGASI